MTNSHQEGPHTEAPLSSWKEIAAYLQRDVSTVIRWEKLEGLPVRRHQHKDRSSIYAYPSELDAWRARRKPQADRPHAFRWHCVPAFASAVTLTLALIMSGSGPYVGKAARAAEPVFRHIEIPSELNSAAVLSPDGTKLAFVSDGEIWTLPVHGKASPDIAGEPEKLTQGAEALELGVALSGNGQWIAFNRNLGDGRRPTEIYLVPAMGGTPRKIALPELTDRGRHAYNYGLALSPDGSSLAFSLVQDGVLRLFQTKIGSGEAKALTSCAAREPAFAPDGERLAYVKLTGSPYEASKSEVRILSLRSGKDVLAGQSTNRVRSPVWSPGGTHLAFLIEPEQTNRSREVWIVPAPAGDQPAGEPARIPLPENSFLPLAGWTAENQVGFLLSRMPKSAVYTLPVSGGMAVKVTPDTDGIFSADPQWGPDGKKLLMRYGDGSLAYVPSDGGKPSEIPIVANPPIYIVSPGGGNRISPDGQKIVISAVHKDETKAHIWTLPAGGGDAVQVTSATQGDRHPSWSPDGKMIAFVRRRVEGPAVILNVCTVASAGGAVRQVTADSDKVMEFGTAWSPDGSRVAYFSTDGKLKLVRSSGGPSTVVTELPGMRPVRDVAWTPDGQTLIFSANWKIFSVSAGGGQPVEISTGMKARTVHLGLSPDGRRLAFTGIDGGQLELWLMENFLPAP